jgi:CRISPR-associated protein Cmr6
MPVAAVPKYLGSDFKEASPGLRFGLYLAIWTTREDQVREVNSRAAKKSKEGQSLAGRLQQVGMNAVINQLCGAKPNPLPRLWEKNNEAGQNAWRTTAELSRADRERMMAFCGRQAAMRSCIAPETLFHLDACSVAPFTTGLGNEHPLENGFSFLNPYGLPYLPGSGVKGVLRQAARELACGEWGDSGGWSKDAKYEIRVKGEEAEEEQSLRLDLIDVLFGRETPEGDTRHFRGVLTFWDVIPEIKADHLLVEIMTPHQSHYYQQKPEAGSGSPHDSGQPNPICFLTVPPGSRFVFHVICDTTQLARVAPGLVTQWKPLLEKAFEHAFQWLGFGAKTAVGDGAMVHSKPAAKANEPSGQANQTSALAPQGLVWENARLDWNPGQNALSATLGKSVSAPLTGEKLAQVLTQLGEAKTAELKKKKHLSNVSVRVEQLGNKFTILGIESRDAQSHPHRQN